MNGKGIKHHRFCVFRLKHSGRVDVCRLWGDICRKYLFLAWFHLKSDAMTITYKVNPYLF